MTSENVQQDEAHLSGRLEDYRVGHSSAKLSAHATCSRDVGIEDGLAGKRACGELAPGEAVPQEVVAFKFGGSSLLGAERMLHAANIVRSSAPSGSVVVIVSAMRGVTDRLLAIGSALENGKLAAAQQEAEGVMNAHLGVLSDLQLNEGEDLRVRREMQSLGRDLLHDVNNHSRSLSGSAEWLDRLASYGERLSARLFAAALEKSGVDAVPVTSSDFVRTCENFCDARPDLLETRQRGRDVLLPLLRDGIVPVVTGFIGATLDGRITTLGRNSSDFSGAIVAHVVDADELVIWTDVDGIFTANPTENQEAQLLHEMSYDDAHALAQNGAKVLHAKVLPLAAETEMVVWVRNTFNPTGRGTRIGPRADISSSEDGGQR
jgi:bifunctional aspartokinase / homoserine dehydrogenase 1